MNEAKSRRQDAIATLIRTAKIANQEELSERLQELGFPATQATISRDLEQLGAVKVRRNGQLCYALVGQGSEAPPQRLAAVLREWVRAIDTAANLVVIKTPPGSAHVVGLALDESELPHIVGTICGDDTIFVACRGSSEAEELAVLLRTRL